MLTQVGLDALRWETWAGPTRLSLAGAHVDDSMSDESDDDRLVVRARAGDTGAFEVLVRRHQGLAIRTADLVGAAEDAEDAAQDASLRPTGRSTVSGRSGETSDPG